MVDLRDGALSWIRCVYQFWLCMYGLGWDAGKWRSGGKAEPIDLLFTMISDHSEKVN